MESYLLQAYIHCCSPIELFTAHEDLEYFKRFPPPYCLM